MDIAQYGPFANVVAVALALVATFSVLLLKMLGRISLDFHASQLR